ncbi:MAG: hypothetical protein AAF725_16165, partial [Acidobacteriota bacterium]
MSLTPPWTPPARQAWTPLLAMLTLGLVLSSIPLFASTPWPGLRGPDFDGSARGDVRLIEGDELALQIAWKKELGSGYSSVVVGEGRVITMFSAGDADVMGA